MPLCQERAGRCYFNLPVPIKYLLLGDYESLILEKEVKAGATLEQMGYYWIDLGADRMLQKGLGQDADDKQRTLACIRADEAGLAAFYELFSPGRCGYERNAPCCEFS